MRISLKLCLKQQNYIKLFVVSNCALKQHEAHNKMCTDYFEQGQAVIK